MLLEPGRVESIHIVNPKNKRNIPEKTEILLNEK
jgi:hypothetical protein